ncbi:hypothetical protein ABFT80_22535 [Mesorhizobium sp. SB112]|uniref:hypothetical protein n=1 Tax=Mesorhizobium sp. SB112 TaxID=3151853 RepID=UPI003264492B
MSGIFAAFLNIGAAAAMPVDMTVDRLLNICKAPTVQAAIASGNELGWPRQADAELEKWRTHFVAYNGGSVDVVGWRRDNAGGAESLSFWIAVGPNGHKACAYSTKKPDGLLDALSESLGAPDSLEKNDTIETISAFWKRGAIEYSFTQVGSYAGVTIGPSQ